MRTFFYSGSRDEIAVITRCTSSFFDRAGGGRRGVRWPARLSDRTKERCGIALAASWFTMLTVQSECDEVDFDLLVKNKLLNPDEEQTGWDRLAAMYTLDEMGGLTPELELVTNIATAGLLIGGSLGAMLNGRLAIIKFVERNQATPFESQIVAKRALQDRLTLGMARGFFIFGWRTALFTSAFTLVSTTLMVYTNQISALHYCCGGVVAGALYKASMGLRGMTAGAVAGGILGLIGGGVFSLTCYLTGTTLPKLRYQQYLWKHQQELVVSRAMVTGRLVLAALVMVMVLSAPAAACPKDCECSASVVDCSHRGLTRVPFNIPRNTHKV
ncbi:hypothetical protein FJT64_004228 [Amphibalanus amphitrite]|uniref:Complex I assembly factor TIMMDC1, mitochondrial n=1 Tax=Amphibalanus amphitrite TaxID=1232801 RepID=A0A6A4VU77_AMPAM|nr:hypothetical protein FJT64_004228 [Amphibalanus amphitrite]